MKLISEYENEIVETDDIFKIDRLKKQGFREFNDISNAPKAKSKRKAVEKSAAKS